MKRILVLAALLCLPVIAGAQQQSSAQHPQVQQGAGTYHTAEKAKVEQVFKITEAGYKFIAYLVTWQGQHVIVSDALAISDHVVGDEIEFMVDRIETPATPKPLRTISFVILEHGGSKGAKPK